jgi:hypothetical protein
LTDSSCDTWATKLAIRNKPKGDVVKKKHTKRQPERKVHTKNNFSELFDDDLIGQYGTQEDVHKCGVKRSVEVTPPSSTHKVRAAENGTTPTTPLSRQQLNTSATTSDSNGSDKENRYGAVYCVTVQYLLCPGLYPAHLLGLMDNGRILGL